MIFPRAALARKAHRVGPRSFAAASIASSRAASKLTLARTVRPEVDEERDHHGAFALADFSRGHDLGQSRSAGYVETPVALVHSDVPKRLGGVGDRRFRGCAPADATRDIRDSHAPHASRPIENTDIVDQSAAPLAHIQPASKGREIGHTLLQFAELPDRCSAGLLVQLRFKAVLMRAMWDKA